MQYWLFIPRIAVLTIVLLLAHVVAAAGVGLTGAPPESRAVEAGAPAADGSADADPAPDAAVESAARPDMGASLRLLGLVGVVCVLEAIAIGALVAGSRVYGWRLIIGLAVAIFGVATLQPQLEALAFGVVRPGFALRIGAMGLLIAALVAPVAVLVFWRVRTPRGAAAARADGVGGVRAPRAWWVTVLLVGAIYVGLYLVFGYFVAWRSPEVRAYYGGDASRGFLTHLWALQLRVPWFGPFQFGRGCLWAALGLAIVPMLGGGWVRAGMALGLFFAVMMNAQLLLPNAMMPEAVRLVHIAETAPSNFLLGIVLARLIRGGWRGRAPLGYVGRGADRPPS